MTPLFLPAMSRVDSGCRQKNHGWAVFIHINCCIFGFDYIYVILLFSNHHQQCDEPGTVLAHGSFLSLCISLQDLQDKAVAGAVRDLNPDQSSTLAGFP